MATRLEVLRMLAELAKLTALDEGYVGFGALP